MTTPSIDSLHSLHPLLLQYGDIFTYNLMGRPTLFVGPKFAAEVWQNPDVFDLAKAAEEMLKFELILGAGFSDDRYDARLIHSQLNPKLGDVAPLALKEIQDAIDK